MRQGTGVLRRLRRWNLLTAQLALVCSLQLLAGPAWTEEIHRVGQLRRAQGAPPLLSDAVAFLPGPGDFDGWLETAGTAIESTVGSTSRHLAAWGSEADSALGEVAESFVDLAQAWSADLPVSDSGGSASALGAWEPRRNLPDPPSLPVGLGDFGTPPWHLLSVPDEPSNVDPSVLLPTVAGDFTLAYAYDACDSISPWHVYDPNDLAANDLTAIDHRIGFWLKATDPDPLAVTGTEPAETSIQLCQGWNLIGYPLAQGRPVLAALSSIVGKFLRVYGFDPTDEVEPWKVYDVAVPDWVNTLQVMERGKGYWIYATEDTTLVMRNVGPPPEVEITSPASGAKITDLTDVIGSVRSDLLQSWELAYRLSGESEFIPFATGDTPVLDDFLGIFDPTLLLNGLYEIKLEAVDFQGQSASVTVAVVVEGGMKIGQFSLSFTDLIVPLVGMPIEVTRTYDSRDKRVGDFGVGWRIDLTDFRLQETGVLGAEWEGFRSDGPLIYTYCVLPIEEHRVTVTLPDGKVLDFRAKVEPDCQIIAPPQLVTVVYEPLGGTFAELVPLDHDEQAFVVGGFPGTIQLWDLDTVTVYDPSLYRLTLRDGRSFVLSDEVGLVSITDLNGNTLTVGADGITHSSGIGITFERDGEGRITTITDPAGERLEYTYDTLGDLVAVRNREDDVTRFTYGEDHFLLEIEDPRGIRPLRNEYDDDGRLVRHIDAFGQIFEVTHDLDARRDIQTNRLGHSRILEYDERGNVVRMTDTLGGVMERSFDAFGNRLSETDPLGNTAEYTYDAEGNLTSVTDPLGNTSTYTFNERGQVLTVTDAGGRVTANTYDENGNPTSMTDAAGNLWSRTYDNQGNVLSVTTAEGEATTFEYDARGFPTREVDALGHERSFTHDALGNRLTETERRTLADGSTETLVTSYTYNALGRMTSLTDPAGATTTFAYDPLGKLLETVDPLGRRTALAYDPMGRLVTQSYADGTAQHWTYDAEGKVLSMTDRGGRTTLQSYDPRGYLVATTLPDGTTRTKTWDAAGRLIAETDARGNVTRYEHDAANRRTRIVDALDNVTAFTFDANRHEIAITDALGRTTGFEYDALDRLTRTVMPDGTDLRTTYDKVGRVLTTTDPLGRVTHFGYDALGRLQSVTDAAGAVTSYTWDEVGNRLSQADAKGHVTRFTYDPVGRLISRTLPGGATETRAYDAAGQLTGRTGFDGATVTWTYDLNGWLAGKSFPDGSGVQYGYTATGRRASVTDARGTTVYAYDSRDRLIGLTYPDGRRLEYEYDPEGNRTAVDAVLATETLRSTYTYDALHRLVGVTNPGGGAYTLTYDAVGNRTSLVYPSGLRTLTTYDALRRLTSLVTETPSGDVVQSYAYTLDAAGNRLAVVEHDGTRRGYAYDALNRLTEESVTDALGDVVFKDTYSYDAVGNRLSHTATAADATEEVVTFTYDDRDRLLSAGETVYTWDGDGDLVHRSAPQLDLEWDVEDRLTRAEAADGSITTYTYDADGNRVQTTATSGSDTAVTEYLVDPSVPLPRVVTETDGSGGVVAHHVWGDELLATLRGGAVDFVHADGLGSIRALSDEQGDVTDRYTFSAFGELLEHTGSSPNAFLFAGEPFDAATGFSYNRARWLDTAAGRFLSMDPLLGNVLDPASLHAYLYAQADPVNKTDPSGMQTIGEMAMVGAMIGALTAYVVFQPQGPLETIQVLLWGALAGAALFTIMAWWAGIGTTTVFGTTAGAAGGAATVGAGAASYYPVVQNTLLRLPQNPGRIYLGSYGGRGFYWLGERITGVLQPGLQYLKALQAQFGGRVLDGIRLVSRADFVKLQTEIDAADEIVFNISQIQYGTWTWLEYQYILSRADLMQKTIWVTGGTF